MTQPFYLKAAFAVTALAATNLLFADKSQPPVGEWPELTAEAKPWTRWWWHGSAVNEEEIRAELAEFARVGIGGVEITPIYGVKGEETLNLEFLSEPWLEIVKFACQEANRLGMMVDIVPGTGWRLGREDLPHEDRAVELKLEKDSAGHYTANPHESGERVKRPAPGGSGFTLDMLKEEAVERYFEDFNQRFYSHVPPELTRAQFHDSWEYETDWSHDFLSDFERIKGYDLQPYLQVLDMTLPHQSDETANRVRYDYRSTLEALTLEAFTEPWNRLSDELHVLTRNQAHGSIANLLDVYAQADIPETEIFREETNPLIQKFASSAANVTGKRLASAESFTWLGEHWQIDLSKIKRYADFLFLTGINHILYHGTSYSPPNAAWPGWVFYASTQINNRNPIWKDLPDLNEYIARCQSFLQSGSADNDILLYWPISDLYSTYPGRAFKFHISGDKWTAGNELKEIGRELWDKGYLFDYVSDRQLLDLAQGDLAMRDYKVVVLPRLKRMPEETLNALLEICDAGVQVVSETDPKDWIVPGLYRYETRQKELDAVITSISRNPHFTVSPDAPAGLKDLGFEPDPIASQAQLKVNKRKLDDHDILYFVVNQGAEAITLPLPESLVDTRQVKLLDPWNGQVGLAPVDAQSRPYFTLAPNASLFLRIADFPTQTETLKRFSYPRLHLDEAVEIDGEWDLAPLAGGPDLTFTKQIDQLVWLNDLNDLQLDAFSGTLRYRTQFERDTLPTAERYFIDLGELANSARVFVNGTEIGLSIMPPHLLEIPTSALKPASNLLEIEITNLGWNRIRQLDRNGVQWQIFEDINFVNLDYRHFDASTWPVQRYGLKGPVRILASD